MDARFSLEVMIRFLGPTYRFLYFFFFLVQVTGRASFVCLFVCLFFRYVVASSPFRGLHLFRPMNEREKPIAGASRIVKEELGARKKKWKNKIK